MSARSKLVEGTEILRTGGGVHLTSAECNTLLDLYEAAKALHTQVEMAESVGVCLPSRVESLSLEAAIAECG